MKRLREYRGRSKKLPHKSVFTVLMYSPYEREVRRALERNLYMAIGCLGKEFLGESLVRINNELHQYGLYAERIFYNKDLHKILIFDHSRNILFNTEIWITSKAEEFHKQVIIPLRERKENQFKGTYQRFLDFLDRKNKRLSKEAKIIRDWDKIYDEDDRQLDHLKRKYIQKINCYGNHLFLGNSFRFIK